MHSHTRDHLDLIRVETALSRYPLHRLAKLGTIAIDLRETTDNGDLALRWEVSHNSKFGQPGPLAYKVDTLVVNRKIEQAGRPIPRIIRLGSLAEIAAMVGTGEKNTTKVKRALHQNASAYITATITYRTKGGAQRTCEIGDTRYAVVFKGESLPNGLKAEAVYIVLHDFYAEILNHALTRPLDYDYLRELPPMAQRWYELASFQVFAAVRYGKPARLSYAEFCRYAPQTRYGVAGEVRKQMIRIHEPHLRSGYIADARLEATTDKEGRPDWLMTYVPGPKAKAEHATPRRAAPALEAQPEPTGLEAELVKRGVSRRVAAELIAAYPAAHIQKQMEAVDWLQAKKPGKVKDVGAYLADAIRKDYAAPRGLELGKAKQAHQAAEEVQARQRAAERARQQAEQAQLDAYWQSLTPEQQAKLEAEALAGADPEMREGYENAPLPAIQRAQLKFIRDAYLRKLLGLPMATPPR
jgi:hypothetical protein